MKAMYPDLSRFKFYHKAGARSECKLPSICSLHLDGPPARAPIWRCMPNRESHIGNDCPGNDLVMSHIGNDCPAKATPEQPAPKVMEDNPMVTLFTVKNRRFLYSK